MFGTGATPVRVIRRIHGIASHAWPSPQPTIDTSFALYTHETLKVRQLTDARPAIQREFANLCRLQLDRRVLTVFGDNRSKRARRPNELTTGTSAKLDIMNDRACRNTSKRQSISWHNIGGLTCKDRVAGSERERRQYVTQNPVLVLNQRNVRRAIWRILDAKDRGWNILAATLEVDEAQTLSSATTSVPRGDPA